MRHRQKLLQYDGKRESVPVQTSRLTLGEYRDTVESFNEIKSILAKQRPKVNTKSRSLAWWEVCLLVSAAPCQTKGTGASCCRQYMLNKSIGADWTRETCVTTASVLSTIVTAFRTLTPPPPPPKPGMNRGRLDVGVARVEAFKKFFEANLPDSNQDGKKNCRFLAIVGSQSMHALFY